jgi:signal transduction histidine kinase
MVPSGRFGASLPSVSSSVHRNLVAGLDPVRVDWAIGAALLVAFELQVWSASGQRLRGVQALVAVLIAAAVALRRRWTLQALVVACVAALVKQAVAGGHAAGHGVLGPIAIVLVIYSAGAFLDGRRAWIGLAVTVVLGAAIALHGSSLLGALFGFVAFILLPWVVGRARRLSVARERASRELAERMDSERELHVRAAALGERTRLAREIHDVIAHSVSVMVIQAAGARTVMDGEPDRAEASLRSVERAGRDALAEMRRLLGVLAKGEELRALAPQPGLEDLRELVSSTCAAGLRTSIRVEGEPVAVSPGLSLCAYRVVQEALTNSLKHAGPTSARVQVRWRPDALELQVSDAGGRRESPPGSSGHGLVGMRERAALHGGSVEAGPGPGGGFVVRARIPLLTGSAR